MVIFEQNIGHLTETSISIQSTTSIGVFSLGGNDENITLVSTGCMTVWERDGITHRRPLLVQSFCPNSYFSVIPIQRSAQIPAIHQVSSRGANQVVNGFLLVLVQGRI